MADSTPSAAPDRRIQEIRALELRTRGASVRDIARDLGVGRSTAHRRLTAALDTLEADTSERLRTTVELRLDDVLRRLYRLLDDQPNTATELKILALILAAERDRVRLLGLAVPSDVVLKIEGVTTRAS